MELVELRAWRLLPGEGCPWLPHGPCSAAAGIGLGSARDRNDVPTPCTQAAAPAAARAADAETDCTALSHTDKLFGQNMSSLCS